MEFEDSKKYLQRIEAEIVRKVRLGNVSGLRELRRELVDHAICQYERAKEEVGLLDSYFLEGRDEMDWNSREDLVDMRNYYLNHWIEKYKPNSVEYLSLEERAIGRFFEKRVS